MGKNFKITGLEKVQSNLNKEIKKIKRRSMKGLIQAAIMVRRDMDKTPPLIPLDLGNLRASSFIVTGLGGNVADPDSFEGEDAAKMKADHNSTIASMRGQTAGKFLVALGFSANYAAAVEENNDPKEWKRPGSGRAFFQSSLKRNKRKILKVIAEDAKIR